MQLLEEEQKVAALKSFCVTTAVEMAKSSWLGSWSPTLPRDLVEGPAATSPGDPAQFLHLARKLRGGQPVTILAVGSSIVERAGCTEPAPALRTRACLAACPKCCGSRCQVESGGWGTQFFEWLNGTFPPSSGKHRLINLGEPGSDFFRVVSSCPATYVDFVADLVLLEPLTAEPSTPAVERLVRRFLAQRAAIIVLDVFKFAPLPCVTALGWMMSVLGSKLSADAVRTDPFGAVQAALVQGSSAHKVLLAADGCTECLEYSLAIKSAWCRKLAAATDPTAILTICDGGRHKCHNSYLRHLQDEFVRVSAWERYRRHYGLAGVSLFGAFGLAFVEHSAQLGVSWRNFSHDGLHPRGIHGARYISDLLIHRLRTELSASDLRPHVSTALLRSSSKGEALGALPEPMLPQPVTSGWACFDFDREGYQAMGRRGSGHEKGRSRVGTPKIVPKIVARRGWKFSEYEERSRTKHKPGLVATHAGALLTIGMDLATGASASKSARQIVWKHTTGLIHNAIHSPTRRGRSSRWRCGCSTWSRTTPRRQALE